MEFYQADVLKMGFAALAGAAVAAGIFVIALFNGPRDQVDPKGARISWNQAEKLRSDYLQFKPIMVEYTNPSTGGKIRKPLEGFKMSASHIDEVINRNKNGAGGNVKADSLILYFGINGTSGTGVNQIANLQLIAAGLKNGRVLKNSIGADQANSSIFDRADPCPPNPVPN